VFTVKLTSRAEQDITQNADWWEAYRSKEQADRWYQGIYKAMQSLSSQPARCGTAPEASELGLPLRHLLFGISRRATHRVLFRIEGDDVIIYRVLHMSQAVIEDDADLS